MRRSRPIRDNMDAPRRLIELFLDKYNSRTRQAALTQRWSAARRTPEPFSAMARVRRLRRRPPAMRSSLVTEPDGEPRAGGARVFLAGSASTRRTTRPPPASRSRCSRTNPASLPALRPWPPRATCRAIGPVRGRPQASARPQPAQRRAVQRAWPSSARATASYRRGRRVRASRLWRSTPHLARARHPRHQPAPAGRHRGRRARASSASFAGDPYHVVDQEHPRPARHLPELRGDAVAALPAPPPRQGGGPARALRLGARGSGVRAAGRALRLSAADARFGSRSIRSHADFSVRTVGLAGLGALGVSFGTVLAMDSPFGARGRRVQLGLDPVARARAHVHARPDRHRVPRWLSEGLSVLRGAPRAARLGRRRDRRVPRAP